MASSNDVELRRNVLARHDEVAATLRSRFERSGTHVVNMVSSPGTGKTTLLTQVLELMVARGRSVAALVGDCATDNDARRLAESGAPVRQIVTEGLCHLEVSMIEEHLEGWDLDDIEFLFIENVGNLVCPASFDLGEATRMVLLSVTEGEDKPLKYPQMFHSAELAVITKSDLAGPCEFDRDTALDNIEAVHPGIAVFETSKRDPASIERLVDHLVVECRRSLTAVPTA
jgi:hydrogenase nickel incorporation protein HypB